ncbi:MAG: IdeS/Mac family cysteine endopeptidase, partial [Akkermansia sp.]|nr:IdeS/Mac family cysteine endopeptidase [Akkermansia sp.]
MKLSRSLVLSLGLTLGMTSAYGATNTGSYWTQGVSEAGGWYDINKTENEDPDILEADDSMCYAAAAANVLAWWQNSPAGSTLTSNSPTGLENIWQELVSCNQEWDAGGDPLLVVNWWVSGVYFPADMDDSAAWERFYLTTEDIDENNMMLVTLHKENFAGYYFDQYGLDNKKLSAFLMDMQQYSKSVADIDFADLLNNGCAITLAIASETAEDGHSITLWGVEYDEEGTLTTMWVTDSDDGAERILKVAVTEEKGKISLGEGYWAEGYYVDGVTVVNARESFKWSTRSAEAYVSWRVNPKTNNGRAGVALLADVFMNEEFAVDKLEDDEENTQEPGDENTPEDGNDGTQEPDDENGSENTQDPGSENTPELDDDDDSDADDDEDSDADDDEDSDADDDEDSDLDDDDEDDSEPEGNGTLAGLKAAGQSPEGDDEEEADDEDDAEEDAEEGAENDSAQDSEDSDEPETAVEAVMNALDAGKMSDRDAAAVAGASTAVLGQALSGDMERQLGAIRNRAAMNNFRHDVVALDAKGASLEQPGRFFAWVNAEGNRAE